MDKDLISILYILNGDQNRDLSGFSKLNGFILTTLDSVHDIDETF